MNSRYRGRVGYVITIFICMCVRIRPNTTRMSNIIYNILNPKEERIYYNMMIRERFAIIIYTCIRLSHVLGMVNGRFVDKTTTAY